MTMIVTRDFKNATFKVDSLFLIIFYHIIRQSFFPIIKINDATIGTAVLLHVVTHNMVVPMGVDANILFFGKAEIQNTLENSMNLWYT